MQIRLFNTLGRRLEELQPLQPGRVKLYTCGPTVYQYAHIGNLRTYLFEDLLVRTLRFFGYQVKHVMNITDVGHLTDDADQGEDKMLKGAREQRKSVWEIAEHYTGAFFRDLEALNIAKPDIACRATDHIQDMIDLIARLERSGFTYRSAGNVYFDVDKLPDYGKLTGQSREQLLSSLKAGARVEMDAGKRNPLDFVLWFTRSKFEHQSMLWDSPWGRGYPGWHIECSAMSMKYLGEEFDIHCGGVDHIQVHHTNEIAQSEAATGRRWVSHWLHSEFLVLDKEKMAKSGGNFLTLSSLQERGYQPLDYRYLCLGAHYRSQLQFTFPGLDAARSGRLNLIERVLRVKEEAGERRALPEEQIGGRAGELLETFRSALASDLNLPQALAAFWDLLKDGSIAAEHKLPVLLAMDRVLALDLDSLEAQEIEEQLRREIENLIEERNRARERKDFARADQIREALKQKGIILEDTPGGVRWRRDFSEGKL